eukprot:TRINITY_DN107040_c0_g1_i1.p1 TRINITY_DN107040_c0_g1~~TRINITY_DN107040_c0_g1_i1.p1  ORF type:complete len:428 (-),score=103.32 TRINITY_DN107040_c0_g1_i1:66-1325(-)
MSWSPLDRTPLDDLLFRHRHAISALSASLAEDLAEAGDRERLDQVWLLRYVLSFEDDLAGATAAAKESIVWRKEHATVVQAARDRQVPAEFTEKELQAIEHYFVAAFKGCTLFGDPIFVCRLSAYNLKGLMDIVSEEKLELWFNFINECAWQYCEAETKARRYFVKQINIQDASSVKMVQERRFLRALGNSSKVNDWLRPQMAGKTYLFNPPMWLSMASKIAAAFMSRKSLEKIVVHSVRVGTSEPRPALCPFAQQLLGDASALPTFLGGSFEADEALPATSRNSLPADLPVREPPKMLAGLPLPRSASRGPASFSALSDKDGASVEAFEVFSAGGTFQSVVSSASLDTAESSSKVEKQDFGRQSQQLPLSVSGSSVEVVTIQDAAEDAEVARPRFCHRICCFRRRRRMPSVSSERLVS